MRPHRRPGGRAQLCVVDEEGGVAIGVGGGGEHRVSKWDGREADEGGRVAEVHGGVVGREEGGGGAGD